MNLTELGECTDSQYDKEHVCKENNYPKFDRLVHCVESHGELLDSWQQHGIHYADAEEVKIGDADYEGEITYHTMIVVNFCPFCGCRLSEN